MGMVRIFQFGFSTISACLFPSSLSAHQPETLQAPAMAAPRPSKLLHRFLHIPRTLEPPFVASNDLLSTPHVCEGMIFSMLSNLQILNSFPSLVSCTVARSFIAPTWKASLALGSRRPKSYRTLSVLHPKCPDLSAWDCFTPSRLRTQLHCIFIESFDLGKTPTIHLKEDILKKNTHTNKKNQGNQSNINGKVKKLKR